MKHPVYAARESSGPTTRLTSTKNPLLQGIRRAAAAGRPTADGLIVAEGPRLLEEALHGTWRIEQVLTTGQGRDRYANLLARVDAEILEVSPRALAATAGVDTAQELLALLRPREWSWPDLMHSSALIVMLDGVQDPGNAGTIVRSAEAFGATGVVFLRGCTRVANGKLLRATAGSIFRIPFLEGVTAAGFLEQIRLAGLTLYGLASSGQSSLPEVDFCCKFALGVGSEGAGISAELLSKARTISIRTLKVESLNAAVACSIALFEAQRQRSLP